MDEPAEGWEKRCIKLTAENDALMKRIVDLEISRKQPAVLTPPARADTSPAKVGLKNTYRTGRVNTHLVDGKPKEVS